MGAGASAKVRTAKEVVSFIGSGSSAVVLARKGFKYGSFVAIDVDETRRKDQHNIFEQDVTLRFGVVKGACAAPGHNAFEYSVQVDGSETLIVRRRFLGPLRLLELEDRDIEVSPKCREVAVEVEWQGGAKYLAELLKREWTKGELRYEVRFVGGKREVLSGLPIEKLHPVDGSTRCFDSPEMLAPDPLWLLDRKLQADIDVKWPIARRMEDALKLLRSQMRPPGAPPVKGPFEGERLFDSEGFPAHPAPMEELQVDRAFIDTWGRYAGEIKFASTYKIGPAYPGNKPWVKRVDAGDPLYFHAALPVYAGLICLGMFKMPDERGMGQPEWVRASDVALVGIAMYVNGEHVRGFFNKPPLQKDGVKKCGHESCHFIPGCVSTYLGDSTYVGGTFCLAPSEADFEVRDDIYSIQAYHAALRDWAKRQSALDDQDQPREIDVQINLVLSTSYLANLRQVCAGSVKVVLSAQGLAIAHERLQHVQNLRMKSSEAESPKRSRKNLSELLFEAGVERRLGAAAAVPNALPDMEADASQPPPPEEALGRRQAKPPPTPLLEQSGRGGVSPGCAGRPICGPEHQYRPLLEHRGAVIPPPPPPKGSTSPVRVTRPSAPEGVNTAAGIGAGGFGGRNPVAPQRRGA